MKLLVLAQARQWLSATERLDPIANAPPTPKTDFQLADATKQTISAEYARFGHDFEKKLTLTALLLADYFSTLRSTIAMTMIMEHSAHRNKCCRTHIGSYKNGCLSHDEQCSRGFFSRVCANSGRSCNQALRVRIGWRRGEALHCIALPMTK